MLPVIQAHSQTAVYLVTYDLSCQDEVKKEHVAVVMTGTEDEVVEREVEEEEKLTEEGGKLLISLLQ